MFDGLDIGSLIAWQTHIINEWNWLVLFVLMLIAGIILLRIWLKRHSEVIHNQQQTSEREKDFQSDPAFYAYLGHNVITESSTHRSGNTSTHAIESMSSGVRQRDFRNLRIDTGSEIQAFEPMDERWFLHSYDDSPTKQVSFGNIETIFEPETQRYWQRKTMQFHGV